MKNACISFRQPRARTRFVRHAVALARAGLWQWLLAWTLPANAARADFAIAQSRMLTPTPAPSLNASSASIAAQPALSLPPLGRAAPPTEAATRSQGIGGVRAGLEVFSEYALRWTSNGQGNVEWFHTFDVPRVHGAIEGNYSDLVRGRVVIEAVRSASEGALMGVAGDSLVFRAREAFGAVRPFEALEVSAGVVPTLTVPEADGTWMMRVVAPSALEASGLGAPADLGVKARLELPRGYGWLGGVVANGEGYASREFNRGKTAEGAVELHPAPNGALLPLGLFASYVAGSAGTVSARADRWTSGLVWQGQAVRAGAFFTYAWGVRQSGTQQAIAASALVRVEPWVRVIGAARVDVHVRDVTTGPADAVTTAWLSAGYRLAEPLEVYVAGSRAVPTARAAAEVPGAEAATLRVMGRVVF